MKKFLIDSAIIIVISLAMLFSVEIALRMVYPDKVKKVLFRYDKETYIRLKANLSVKDKSGKFAGIEFRTNSHAFRGKPLMDNPSKRIMVYGDSNVMARFSHFEETLPYKLEKYLKGSLDENLEVINAGTNGFGPDQNLIRFKREADVFAPDLVVFVVFMDNDFGDLIRNRLFELDSEGRLLKTDYPVEMDRAFRQIFDNLLVVRAAQKVLWQIHKKINSRREVQTIPETKDDAVKKEIEKFLTWNRIQFERYQRHQPKNESVIGDYIDLDMRVAPDSEPARTKMQLMIAVLEEASEFAVEKNIKFLLVGLPSRIDLTANDEIFSYKDLRKPPGNSPINIFKPIEAMARQRGIPYVNLFDIFMKNSPEKLYYDTEGNDHWNAAGQDLSAQVIAQYIIAEGLL